MSNTLSLHDALPICSGYAVSGNDRNSRKLFIFEDLHWADPSSLEFFGQFISALNTTEHRLITTSRQPMSGNLASVYMQSLPVNRLTSQATQDFISTLFDGETVSAKLLAVLESRTDGIPLFIEELVNMLRQKALVQKLNGIIEFSSPENLDQVPNSLRDSLQQKLDTLVYAKETAQLAATIGREFDYALLVSASDYDEELVQNDLNELLEAELIIQQRKVKGGRYLFKHALIRDAAYESTTKSNLLKFNLDVATALLAEGFHEPFRVAEHFALAEEWQPGVEHGLQALQESARNSVNLESITIYHQLEQWLTHLPEDTRLAFEKQAIDLAYSAYMAVYGLGSSELLALRQRRSELDQLGEAASSEAEVHPDYLQKWAEYQQLHFGGKIVEAQQLAEAILEDARCRNNRIEQLLLLPLLGQTYHFLGRLEEGMACCNKALALYHDEDDLQLWQKYGVEPKSQALFLMSHIQAFYGQFEQSIDSCNQSEIWARKSGCSMSVDGAATFKAIAYYHQQDRAGASGVTAEYAAKVKGVREPEWLEGYIVSLDDWANDESDFAYSFIMGLWQSDSYGAASLWLPMLCQLFVEQDAGFVEELACDAIQKCMAMEQVAAVPLLHRCLAVAKCRSTDRPDSIDYDHFRQGYQLAMDLKAHGIALDIAVFWLEHSRSTPFAAEAIEALAQILDYFSEGSEIPVLKQGRSLLRLQNS